MSPVTGTLLLHPPSQ